MSESFPVKVRAQTYERIRLAAAVMDCSQTDLLDQAVDVFLKGKQTELEDGISRLRSSLLPDPSPAPGSGRDG